MKKVAFVTYLKSPEITEDDLPVAESLRRCEIEVIATPWDDANIDWTGFDLLVLRSCWDYHHRADEFRSWILQIQERNVPLANSAKTILWNMHKSYLRDLAATGISILPTVWLPKGSEAKLDEILQKQQWQEAVVKPMISADADNTIRTSSAGFSQEEFLEFQKSYDTIVQQFSIELATEGELSLSFFNGQFSHMVRKIPNLNDFRTQKQYDPTFQLETPSDDLLDEASKVLSAVHEPLLYARVDGVIINNKFTLVELELIEPWLIMSKDPGSPDRFADCIVRWLEGDI